MFVVTIERNDNEKIEYYVWDSNELIEVKMLGGDYNYFSIDYEKYEADVEIVCNGKTPAAILKHKEPVIISDKRLADHIDQCVKNRQFDFIPCTPITHSEYGVLYDYALAQNQFADELDEQEEISNDINIAKQYLKTYNVLHDEE